MEEKKKSNGGLIVLIIILLLICIGMGAFIFVNKDKLFTKEAEGTKTEEKATKEVKSTKVTAEAKERIERFIDAGTTLNYGSDILSNFMNGANSLTQEVKYKLVNQALYNENKVEKDLTLSSAEAATLEGIQPDTNEIVDVVKMSDYNEMYESLFNESGKYDVGAGKLYGCPFPAAVNKDKTKLYYYHRCGGTGFTSLDRKVTSIEFDGEYYTAHQEIIEKNLATGESTTTLLNWKFDKDLNFISTEKE